jgi:hypothetical protein
MNRKYVIAAIAAGATIAGCGWYFFKASQRKAAEMQAQLQHALSLAKDGNFADCTALLQATVLEMQQFYGPDDPAAIHAVSILAGVLHRQNILAEAETLMRECAAGLDRTLGEDHEESLGCHSELIDILGAAGKTSEALAMGSKLFDRLCKKLGPNHLHSVKVGVAVCTFMRQEGRLTDSADLARVLVESCRSGSPSAPSAPEPLYISLRALTEILRDTGNIDEAIQCAHELVAVSTANSLEADGSPQSHYLLLNLQMSVGIEDALLTARSIANYCEQQHGALSHEHVESQLVLARLLHQGGVFQEAFTVWESAYVVLSQNLGQEHPEILDLQVRVLTCVRSHRLPPHDTALCHHAPGSNGHLLAADRPTR